MDIIKSHKAHSGEVRFYQHASNTTKTNMHFSAFVPKGKIKGGLIWLSGLTCNEENFITKANALYYLNKYGLCLICPDTSPRGLNLAGEHDSWDFGSGASFYINATTSGYKNHYLMQDYIIKELLEMVNHAFSLKDNISIFGHSMGGHGALYLALTFPECFRSVSAFSPIVNPTQCPWGKKAFNGYLGNDKKTWEKYDSCMLLENGKKHPNPLLITQGLADEFLDTQLKPEHLAKACQQSGQALRLEYEKGYDHSYYFISTFIKSHLKFHLKYLENK